MTNSGTALEAVFDFVIPQGEKGERGEPGAKGDTGPQGAQGPPGTAAECKRTARFVVGTSTAGWTAADCDYLCDGTDDQVEINAAIQALPVAGGEVIILDGTYNITANITMTKNNTKLTGNGTSTILKVTGQYINAINITSRENCTVKCLNFDLINAQYATGISISESSNITSTENFFYHPSSSFYIEQTKRCIVSKNVIKNATETAIHITTSDNLDIIISENIITDSGSPAILVGAVKNSIISNNICNTKKSGIEISSASNNMVTGNTCIGCSTGIRVSSYCSNNSIIGNMVIRGNGESSDYDTRTFTIKVESGAKNTLVANNNCMGKAPVDAGTNTTLANNKY